MERVNKIFFLIIKKFICNDTIQFSSGKPIIVKPDNINKDRAILEFDTHIGIKNLKLSGEWVIWM